MLVVLLILHIALLDRLYSKRIAQKTTSINIVMLIDSIFPRGQVIEATQNQSLLSNRITTSWVKIFLKDLRSHDLKHAKPGMILSNLYKPLRVENPGEELSPAQF